MNARIKDMLYYKVIFPANQKSMLKSRFIYKYLKQYMSKWPKKRKNKQ